MPSGFTRLEPQVVDEILRICKVMLDEFDQSRETARRLLNVDGFGEFASAQQLAAGYKRKASGTSESAVERIEQFTLVLLQLRDAFATGGEAFLDTEADWAHQLAITDPDNEAGNGHQSAQ